MLSYETTSGSKKHWKLLWKIIIRIHIANNIMTYSQFSYRNATPKKCRWTKKKENPRTRRRKSCVKQRTPFRWLRRKGKSHFLFFSFFSSYSRCCSGNLGVHKTRVSFSLPYFWSCVLSNAYTTSSRLSLCRCFGNNEVNMVEN